MVNDQKICAYVADFKYNKENADGIWEHIIEDAKGVETPEFKLKKKLMKAVFDIDIYLSKKFLTDFPYFAIHKTLDNLKWEFANEQRIT